MTAAPWPSPAPGAAPVTAMITAQAGLETRVLLRNGEQLLLTLIIPVLLLVAFSLEPLVKVGQGHRVNFLVPGIIALAVISTAFTSQAIATGFERRYGVLKRLGATPLPRSGLIAAKTLTVLSVEAGQIVVISLVGLALGWQPHGGVVGAAAAVLLVLAGTAAFSGLGLLLAGTLRAEATLAVANLIYLVLIGIGGVIFPLARFPAGVRTLLTLLPSGALSDGLRSVLSGVAGSPLRDLAVLVIWAAAAIALAARMFRWEEAAAGPGRPAEDRLGGRRMGPARR
jgi:ABC-2 type transport system permease protein